MGEEYEYIRKLDFKDHLLIENSCFNTSKFYWKLCRPSGVLSNRVLIEKFVIDIRKVQKKQYRDIRKLTTNQKESERYLDGRRTHFRTPKNADCIKLVIKMYNRQMTASSEH